MINEITLAMVAAIGLRTLARVIHAYPTQAEAIGKAADAYTRIRLTPTIIDQTGGEGSDRRERKRAGMDRCAQTGHRHRSAPEIGDASAQAQSQQAAPGREDIGGAGHRSNLQEMKDLLEAALKLRSELARAIGAGRSRESTLSSSALSSVRSLGNFESFAAQLFDDLAAQRAK
jgi:hypothetical protein